MLDIDRRAGSSTPKSIVLVAPRDDVADSLYIQDLLMQAARRDAALASRSAVIAFGATMAIALGLATLVGVAIA